VNQPIKLEAQGRGQYQDHAVAAPIGFDPTLELLIRGGILVEESEVNEVEQQQQSHSHCAADETQEGSLVVVRPINQLKRQEQTPAE